MKIAKIIDKKTDKVVQIYRNVIRATDNSIEYFNNGYRSIIYIYTDFEYIKVE